MKSWQILKQTWKVYRTPINHVWYELKQNERPYELILDEEGWSRSARTQLRSVVITCFNSMRLLVFITLAYFFGYFLKIPVWMPVLFFIVGWVYIISKCWRVTMNKYNERREVDCMSTVCKNKVWFADQDKFIVIDFINELNEEK